MTELLDHRLTQIQDFLTRYAYNAMEVCRFLNGRGPRDFKGCYYEFDLNRRGPRCRQIERGCQITSSCVDKTLRRMQAKGKMRSIKLRWFDGRSKGAFNGSLQLDVFRIYYVDKAGLARRLSDDIKTHLGDSK